MRCWLPLGLGACSLTPPMAWFHAVEGVLWGCWQGKNLAICGL